MDQAIAIAIIIISLSVIWYVAELMHQASRDLEKKQEAEDKRRVARLMKEIETFKALRPDVLLPGFRNGLSNLLMKGENAISPVQGTKVVCMNGHEWYFHEFAAPERFTQTRVEEREKEDTTTSESDWTYRSSRITDKYGNTIGNQSGFIPGSKTTHYHTTTEYVPITETTERILFMCPACRSEKAFSLDLTRAICPNKKFGYVHHYDR